MKITQRALRSLLREAINGDKILSERPWSVEYTFTMSGDSAEDSEGESADGFAVVVTSDSGKSMRIIVDSYWNPQSDDQSGNSIKVEMDEDDETTSSTPAENIQAYVPHKFDDGKEQCLIISNSPVSGIISISHGFEGMLPIIYLVVPNPFVSDDDDLSFNVEKLGSGNVKVKLTDHVNI